MCMPHLDIPNAEQHSFILQIGHFPVRGGGGRLRYGITPRCDASHGTVLLLMDHGETIEDYDKTIRQLQQRRLHVVIFDWFGQGGSSREKCDNLGGHIGDFRDLLDDLSEIFVQHFLPDFPAPFYVLGSGMGGLLALAAHDMLKSQIRRMILTSPLLQPAGHPAGGSFHTFARLMSDLGMGLWRTDTKLTQKQHHHDPITLTRLMRSQNPLRPTGYPTLATYATFLDAAQIVLSPINHDKMSIPTLFVLSQNDPISPPDTARLFAQNLRIGAYLTLRGASRDILHGHLPHF